ncbi:MAG: hypothetical protein ACI9W0_000641, partial [Gammaproteobacteria bacterium]
VRATAKHTLLLVYQLLKNAARSRYLQLRCCIHINKKIRIKLILNDKTSNTALQNALY